MLFDVLRSGCIAIISPSVHHILKNDNTVLMELLGSNLFPKHLACKATGIDKRVVLQMNIDSYNMDRAGARLQRDP